MAIDIKIEVLSLSFMWVLSAVFCIATYLSYRRAGYTYLRLAVATLIAELLRQIVNNLTIVYPEPIFYLLSSIAIFAESLLFLAAVAAARDKPLPPVAVIVAICGYAASLVFTAIVHSETRWAWYIGYAPVLTLHAFIVRQAWLLYRDRWLASGWLLAASIAVFGTRIMLPWLVVDADIIYGFVYFADGILFSLALGTVMLIALEQLTEEKSQSLAQREQAESTVRFLLDNTEDVIISYADDGTVLSWNNRARQIFGYSEHEAAGRLHISQLIMPSAAGEDRRRETTAFSKDGKRFPVEVARRNAVHGGMVHNTLVIRDRSTMREIEARQQKLSDQLREVQKLESLGALAAGIAHDFNNLLASMMGHAELAAKQLATPMQARQSIDQILTAAHRASELTEQMLTYAGKADFNPTSIDLNATIDEIVSLMSASTSPKASFELEFESRGAWISADRAQLTQVLINLVSNASDALADQEGCIRIATSIREVSGSEIDGVAVGEGLEAGEYVIMQVTDNGEGMSDEVRHRVFEPFFSTKFTGRGLGLAAVAGIVKKHRGAVSVDSAAGRGTTFTFYFPPAQGVSGSRDVTAHDYVPVTSGLSILIVDDKAELRDLCERILASAGHTAIRAGTGEEAIEAVMGNPGLDLLVMDYNLPGKSGLDVYEVLVAEDIRIPVVFISGVNTMSLREQIDPSWCATILKKPFLTDELLEAVDYVSGGETRGKWQARR